MIQQLMQMLKMANDPTAVLRTLAGKNPAVARALEMTNGKTHEEIMEIANNLAKTQGTDIDSLRKTLGV